MLFLFRIAFNHTVWDRRTLPLKSLLPHASLWSKTTLNTSGVGPQTWKMGSSFLMSQALCMSIFNNFQWKRSFERNSQTKISTFIVVKSGNFCLRVSPEAPFYWKLPRTIFQVWGSAPAPPTLPVFRVVLLHTEASGRTLLLRRSVHCL